MAMNDFYKNNIAEDIKNAEKIYIAGHINPDGDAVASTYALALAFKQMGKQAYVLLQDIPDRFNYLYGSEFLFDNGSGDYDSLDEADIFFAIDCGDSQRLGLAAQAVFDKAKFTYCIDHHKTNVGFADVNIINANASSASEIVYELMMYFDIEITKEIATDIYSGIVFDTGGFKHNCTGRRTHEIAGELVEKGNVDTSFIHSVILYEHTLPQAMLFGVALSNMKHKNGISYTTLTTMELEKCGCTTKDLDGIVDFLLNINISQCAVLVTERDDGNAKASVRSKAFPIADIVASLGGGGHMLAAGVTCRGSVYEVAEKIVNLIVDGMKNGQ